MTDTVLHICKDCGYAYPEDAGRCPNCRAIPTYSTQEPGWQKKLREELLLNQRIIANAIRSIPGWREPAIQPIPEEPFTETEEVRHGERKAGITPVDVLAPTKGDSWQVRTSVKPQPVLVAPKDARRRGLFICNQGLPAVDGGAAVTAANAWIDFNESMRRGDSYWLQANGTVAVDTTDAVYALDDESTVTVLHVIRVGV